MPLIINIAIVENAGIKNMADAYKLPKKKNGPVENYSAEGASLQVELSPIKKD